jgi:hypothetical protein
MSIYRRRYSSPGDEFDPGHLNEKVEQTLASAFVGAIVRSGVDGEGVVPKTSESFQFV